MAKRRHGTPGRYAIIAALLCIVLGALTACGRKEEPTETQLGIDGYVYVPRLLDTSAVDTYGNKYMKIDYLKVVGNNLYYLHRDEGSGSTLERIPLPEEAEMPGLQGIDFGAGERLLDFSGGSYAYSEEALEGQRYSVSMHDYTVDEEQNIYAVVSENRYSGINVSESKELLCRYGADGQPGYRMPLDGAKVNGMVPYGSGSLLLLTEDEIRKIDADGNVAERVSIEEYRSGRDIVSERLYGEPGGRIYYVIYYIDATWEVMELVAEGGMRLREVQGFVWKNNVDTNIQGCHDGDLYFTLHSDDTLYLFDGEEGAARKVLRWEDSDIFNSSVEQLWPAGEDGILAHCLSNNGNSGSREEWYLLVRTPVEELPEKELVVLASFSPDLDLRSAVVEYNRQSERYHCIIEQYGHVPGTGDDTGASIRLDAALLSSSPPDILDLWSVDIYKYAEKGVLEDLSPYIEGSGTVRREDFLDGVLEGYTIGGSLVCVPTRFGLNTIVGRDSQTGLLEGWGIEDVYTLMESHPEMTELVSSGFRRLDGPEGGRAEGKGRDYMLKEFFPAYYLERFVDWEAGECSFDSGEFRELLLWLEGHVEKEQPETAIGGTTWVSDYVPEDALLMEARGVEFDDLLQIEVQIGGKARFLGFPTADGRGTAACRVMDKLGMVSHSLHKEGAWDFLEYFISRGAEDSYYLPTQISLLRDMAEKAADPQPGMLTDHYSVRIGIGDDVHEVDEFPQYLADALMEQIEGMDFRPRSAAEEQIIEIVAEEADIYYKGDKSLEDVTAVIQNRVELLLKEAH
ncbi:hypothetical protein [uncultured Acetatifactor sp.]|uniref:hypothetical protein n=1 Tax=uncultured Acetatifactor sp. TaxID=1671927 RepID=UPI0026196C01|nr:hypothetical protein [uncultured Acetatifactor sp.]